MTRTLAEVCALMHERAATKRNPFEFTDVAEVDAALATLGSLERDEWAAAWISLGERRERQGDLLPAANYYRIGRYPAPNSPLKREAHRRAITTYLAAARAFDPPLERVEIPFRGRPGEGDRVIGYLRVPRDQVPRPVLITWGGIDTYKEDRRTDRFLERGIASLAIDMPGVGEAPLRGSTDAERMWDDVFDWVGGEPRLDAARVAVWGLSTGGYWAAKLAHTHAARLVGAVDHGGPAHDSFQREWIEQAQHGEYPFELAETLAWAFSGETLEDWIRIAPSLSLLEQGILDQQCCPLLLVNGVRDSVFSIADMYRLLRHGSPKTARFSETGHMGYVAGTEAMIVAWLCARLAGAAES